jgi:transglutaminase-like putative cysteine protease
VKAVDSYPQGIITIEQQDTMYKLTLKTFRAYDDSLKRIIVENDTFDINQKYDYETKQYLEPTKLIQSDSESITQITDTLFGDRKKTLHIIYKGLKFVSNYITYDDSLANEITKGNSKTVDVNTVLKEQKGTCSEYTNLFIALMRNKGIPARFVTGYIFMPENGFEGFHAWAECYIKDYGWFAVDPQNAFYWLPVSAIRLFYGKDFIDCNIHTLPDIQPIKIEKIE